MEGTEQAAVTANETAPVLGFWGKLGNIFASPRKAFESIDRKPTWIAPLLILIVLVMISTQITFPIIMKSQMDNLRNNPNIPPEQLEVIEKQFTENVGKQRIFALIAQIVGTPIVFLVLAGIFYLVGTLILGGDTTYKKVLSVYSWSAFIMILSTIVTFPLILIKGNMDVSLSLALLLPADAMGTKLHTLLSKFDFFVIWFLAVFASGFGVVYRFSTAKAYTAVGILWAIWIVLSVALSGVFRQFGM
jgi:hypothetical protein